MIRALLETDDFDHRLQPFFDDVRADYPAFKWIQKLREWGYTGGCGARSFCPNEFVSREQAAVFVIRLRYGPGEPFDLLNPVEFADVPADSFFAPWIHKLADVNITSGCSAVNFCPKRPVTRGEFAIFLLRAAFNEFFPNGYPKLVRVTVGKCSIIDFPVAVVGQNTHFEQDVSRLFIGHAVVVPSGIAAIYLVDSPTTLAVTAGADPRSQRAEPHSLVVRTGGEEAVLPNALLLPIDYRRILET